jgi:1-deoxy-D-xylulose-5-phosphate reductoisomerase
MKTLTLLGSTGSIGRNTLEVVNHLKGSFRVGGLAAKSNVPLLAEQAERFQPSLVSVEGKIQADEFRRLYRGPDLRIFYGPEATEEAARLEEADIVVSAISGINGLRATLAAAETGKRIALANKESMVVAGRLVLEAVSRSGAEILPVDSEHCGVFQCLAGVRKEDVRRVILTASGGPFLRTPTAELENKTVEEALAHPRWKMGRKVTVDSATLMNKGLELIEARWLFDLRPEQLEALIHPQSIVHSLVEMVDGSVLAQLSRTDMRLPIQYALTYPHREAPPLPSLDLAEVRNLEFNPVDSAKFPLLGLARRALEEPSSYSVALNAANEEAVEAFLQGRLSFPGIARTVAAVLKGHRSREAESLEDVLSLNGEARRAAQKFIHGKVP